MSVTHKRSKGMEGVDLVLKISGTVGWAILSNKCGYFTIFFYKPFSVKIPHGHLCRLHRPKLSSSSTKSLWNNSSIFSSTEEDIHARTHTNSCCHFTQVIAPSTDTFLVKVKEQNLTENLYSPVRLVSSSTTSIGTNRTLLTYRRHRGFILKGIQKGKRILG